MLFVNSVRLLRLLLLPAPDPKPLDVEDPGVGAEEDENEWSKYDLNGEEEEVGGGFEGDWVDDGGKWFQREVDDGVGVSGAVTEKSKLVFEFECLRCLCTILTKRTVMTSSWVITVEPRWFGIPSGCSSSELCCPVGSMVSVATGHFFLFSWG